MSENYCIHRKPDSDRIRFVDNRTGEIVLSVETSYWVAQAILYGLNNYNGQKTKENDEYFVMHDLFRDTWVFTNNFIASDMLLELRASYWRASCWIADAVLYGLNNYLPE